MRHKFLSILCPALVASAALLFGPSGALAEVPKSVEVHGVVLSAGGGPAADGEYAMTFALYDKAVGGAASWKEGPLKVAVLGGRFTHALGTAVPLAPAALTADKAAFLGVQIGAEPELPRAAVHSGLFTLRAGVADALSCSGCVGPQQLAAGSVGATQLAKGAVAADKLSFAWAGAKVAGGPALSALDLQCTGCVSSKELALDGDLDLGGNSLKAKQLAATDVQAVTISAGSFLGDGSKLTGIKVPAGTCANKGEVVKGIDPAGKLICVAAMDPTALPSDGLDEISAGMLTNEFVHTIASAKAVPIPDNNPTGAADTLELPDLGVAKALKVSVSLTNSNIGQLKITLWDPNNASYVLYDKGGKGTKLEATFPTPDKPVSGDLATWVGKNPKGKWRIKVVDDAFFNNTNDGALASWSVQVLAISNQKVEATGGLVVQGLLSAQGGLQHKNADKPPLACGPTLAGYTYYDTTLKALRICNGTSYYALYLVVPGTKESPATSCKALLEKLPSAASGVHWIDPDGPVGPGPAFQAYCDMDTDGGGWTLLGTVAGGDAQHWNTQYGYWSDTKLLGSVEAPWADYKSQAWVSLDLKGAEVMVQRRYGGVVRARTSLAAACQGGKATFRELFTSWDTNLKCDVPAIKVLTAPSDATGVAGSSYREGASDGLGGSATNGWCWNGGDDNSNTFKGHAGWNQKGYKCLDAGHLGYIGVWWKGDSQYKQTDIDTTNWMPAAAVGQTELSFFAR